MSEIKIENLKKFFGDKEILKGINLLIEDGKFTVLLGPSGCGKTTLLRTISGLEMPTMGEIQLDQEMIVKKEPKDRELAFVFQNYALYPHLTVFKNIEYSLKIKKIPKEKRKEMIQDVLQQVDLVEHEKKLPSQLSGGQKQRVALARAMVKHPKAFLMDEPLSNLDAKLRNSMRTELKRIHKKTQGTFVYVTHDQVEAMSLADKIVILSEGQIVQEGTPKEIYQNPNSVFVAQFIGNPPTNIIQLEEYYLGIRPEHIHLSPVEQEDYRVEVKEIEKEPIGEETLYTLLTSYGSLIMKQKNDWLEETKEFKEVFLEKSKVMIFDEQQRRLSLFEEESSKNSLIL